MSSLPEIHKRTLLDAFEKSLKRSPDKVAQIDRAGRYTFAESFERSLKIAGGLAPFGVKRGTPVATLTDNSLDIIHLFQGLGLTGAIQVPVNTAYKGRFFSHVLNDSEATTIVIEDAYADRLLAIADEVPHLKSVIVRGGKGEVLKGSRFRVDTFDSLLQGNAASPHRSAAHDIQAYFYTSGTTGKSKGVRVPFAHAYTYASREDDPNFSHDESSLVVLPIFHLAGQLYGCYQALIGGNLTVLEPVFSVSKFWPLIREHNLSFTILLGTMAQMLYQMPPQPDDAKNPLKLCYMAPLVSDPKDFAKRFDVRVGSVYGSTECGAPVLGLPETIVGGECGYARKGFDIRIVDENDYEVPVGQAGELVVRSEQPWMMSDGYLNRPDATLTMWRNQWLHTGDAFKRDETGRLFFVDRLKDALRRRGENVSSFEVESVINEYPSVAECAVIGVADDLGEEEIKAIVILKEGHKELDHAALIEFLIPKMPYFMVPRYFEVIPELPKTPTLKVQKQVLRDSGVNSATWDREKAGIKVNRHSK